MTRPVPVIAGASLLSTRRTLGGVFHFTPDPVVNQIVEYLLGYAAQKYQLDLYAFVMESNHLHGAFRDPLGVHPDARRDLHSLSTRAVNEHRGGSEAKWSPGKNPPVTLVDAEAILQAVAYTIANSAHHDLVDDPEDWPGVISKIEELGGPPKIVARPKGFFDDDGDMPELVELRFVKPPILEDWTVEDYRDEIRRRVEQIRLVSRAKRKARGATVVGREAILAQDPTACSRRQPELHTRQPLFKAGARVLRWIYAAWITQFRKEYRAARQQFEADRTQPDITFPFGTYELKRRFRVNCQSTGPPYEVLSID